VERRCDRCLRRGEGRYHRYLYQGVPHWVEPLRVLLCRECDTLACVGYTRPRWFVAWHILPQWEDIE
jgi:hypothetical protein